MFSRKNNNKKYEKHHIQQNVQTIIPIESKKIQLLDAIHFLMEHYYFPGWNTDRICTHKLLGMLAENTEEEIKRALLDYSILADYLEKAINVLLADFDYPNRKLHFDCKRLKILLSSNQMISFDPKEYIGESLYNKYITQFTKCPPVLAGKIIGMFLEAYPLEECFYLLSEETTKTWRKNIVDAICVLKDYIETCEHPEIEIEIHDLNTVYNMLI
jgi:hypothetical protein